MSRSHLERHDDAKPGRTARHARPTHQSRRRRSSRTRDVQRAQQAVEQAPDVRHDRVAAIKRVLESGTLKLNATELAEKLLDDPLHQVDYEV